MFGLHNIFKQYPSNVTEILEKYSKDHAPVVDLNASSMDDEISEEVINEIIDSEMNEEKKYGNKKDE